jgi:hypothetical protein
LAIGDTADCQSALRGNLPYASVSGRTKNNYLQAINVLLEFAKKQKYLPRDFAVMDEVDQSKVDILWVALAGAPLLLLWR